MTSCDGLQYHFNCSVKQYVFNGYIDIKLASAVKKTIFLKPFISSILDDFGRKNNQAVCSQNKSDYSNSLAHLGLIQKHFHKMTESLSKADYNTVWKSSLLISNVFLQVSPNLFVSCMRSRTQIRSKTRTMCFTDEYITFVYNKNQRSNLTQWNQRASASKILLLNINNNGKGAFSVDTGFMSNRSLDQDMTFRQDKTDLY